MSGNSADKPPPYDAAINAGLQKSKTIQNGRRVQCANCGENITDSLYFISAASDAVVLCPNCFASGVELSCFPLEAGYRVSPCKEFSVLEPHWTAREEDLLTEAVQQFGFENWGLIALHVGGKDPQQCFEHYMLCYALARVDDARGFALPSPPTDASRRALEQEHDLVGPRVFETIDPTTLGTVACRMEQLSFTGGAASGTRSGGSSATHAPAASASPAPGAGAGKEAGEGAASAKRGAAPAAGAASARAGEEKGGGGGDPKMMSHDVAGYMPLRDDFDIEYDNDAEELISDMEFHADDAPGERDLKLRVLSIYNRKLDERTRRRKFVRDYGLLNFRREQTMHRRRPRDAKRVHQAMRVFARFHTPEEHNELVSGLTEELRIRARIAELQQYRRMGLRTLAEAEEFSQEKKARDDEAALAKRRRRESSSFSSSKAPRDSANAASTVEQIAETVKSAEPDRRVLDVRGAPGVDQLSAKEVELCSLLRLLPKHYLIIRDAVVAECLAAGALPKEQAHQLINIDATRTGQLVDFFVSCGWVTSVAH